MARKKMRQLSTIHAWSESDLAGAGRLIITQVLDGELSRESSHLMMSLVLNEAHRRREMSVGIVETRKEG